MYFLRTIINRHNRKCIEYQFRYVIWKLHSCERALERKKRLTSMSFYQDCRAINISPNWIPSNLFYNLRYLAFVWTLFTLCIVCFVYCMINDPNISWISNNIHPFSSKTSNRFFSTAISRVFTKLANTFTKNILIYRNNSKFIIFIIKFVSMWT